MVALLRTPLLSFYCIFLADSSALQSKFSYCQQLLFWILLLELGFGLTLALDLERFQNILFRWSVIYLLIRVWKLNVQFLCTCKRLYMRNTYLFLETRQLWLWDRKVKRRKQIYFWHFDTSRILAENFRTRNLQNRFW